ncbi:MAG: hypothetical protein M3069_27195 [Chloroflexota bacterium]|nr:hypothetical protein [Chloroflexota bacterium]
MGGLGGGFLGRLASLFRGGGGGEGHKSPDGGIYIRVKCNACGEIVQARINPTSELSRSDDDSGYFVRKVLVGKQCFRPIEVELRYADMRGKEISREVRGDISVE